MTPNSSSKPALLSSTAFIAAGLLMLLAGLIAYWPGLSGPFLLDDYGSLAKLGDLGGVRDLATFKAFVLGGNSGPTGRPFALLTFLIDGTSWPTDAWSFKRTNLVIHLVNGALLAALSFQVLRIADVASERARWLALVSAGLWLLHPFLVSTTLYAVQRMAQLSTLFIFLGMILHLKGRSLLPEKPLKAYLSMSLSLVVCTVLATLSKENGVLLPLLIGVLELTVIAGSEQRQAVLHRAWSLLFLAVPTALVIAYLGKYAFNGRFFVTNPTRGYSVYERVLTESRVLVDYLRHWFLPQPFTSGVFQDHFGKSSGLFAPATTAPAIAFHAALVGAAVGVRRKLPLLAFSILFFYGAHVLESTVINLELYFEHRNYLAAGFLFLPLLAFLQTGLPRIAFATVSVAALLILAGFTWNAASTWQSYPRLVEAAALAAPDSARAQQQYALQLFNANEHDEGLKVIDAAIERMPDNENLLLSRTTMTCMLRTVTGSDYRAMASVIGNKPYDLRSFELYQTFVNLVIKDTCPAISPADLRALFEDMLAVPVNRDQRQPRFYQIRYFTGRLNLHLGEPALAATHFRESLESRPTASRAMLMAALLASEGHFDEAMAFSNTALSYLNAELAAALSPSTVSEQDIIDFQAQLREEMKTRSTEPR